MCTHKPQCPSAGDIARVAAHVIASHPEQGWSLLCNGIVLFDDGGLLLPNGHTEAVGHAPGARLMPMSQVQVRVGEIRRERPALIVCRSGGRSNAMAQLLSSPGITAVNPAGGRRTWEQAALPVVTDASDPGRIICRNIGPVASSAGSVAIGHSDE